MSKRFLLILAFVFALSPLFAVDFGGKFNTTTRLQGQTFKQLKWYESASLHGWFTAMLSEKYQLKFSSDASYEFRYNQADKTIRNIVDVNLLKLSMQRNVGASRVEASLGRFSVSDVTGVIFNQACDGANVRLTSQHVALNAYIGFTRLLNMHDSIMLTENSDTTVPSYMSKAVYVLGPSYIPMSLALTLPSLFLNQTVSLEALTVLDASESFHRFYATLYLTGPFYKNIFYNASTTFGSSDMQKVSNLTKFNLVYYPVPEAQVGFNLFYASGNQKGVSAFRGVTSMPAVLAYQNANFTTEYESKMKVGVNASYTIASRVYLGADLGVVFACPDKISYNGFQWRFDVAWNIFHDLQLATGMYQYISVDELNKKTCFTLSGTFVF